MELIYLAFVFFKIGVFGFGGGYAMISLIQDEVVNNHQWMNSQTFADVLAISQMTPGPISINTATYVGYNVGGLVGATIATIALCLPSIIMMYFVIRFLFKTKGNPTINSILASLKPAIAGLILSAALIMMTRENFCDAGIGENNISIIICAVTFIATFFFKINPMMLISIAGMVGFFLY
ncbi:MAG: chromate transporter [Paludibacteraceae bacterium]|nr:chromate transporter [Paludibacteraceae bacterium]